MTRIKTHNPTKVVTGGDSSRSFNLSTGMKSYVQQQMSSLMSGIVHGSAVKDIRNDPPSGGTGPFGISVNEGDLYIVGPTPTGHWAGHANEVVILNKGAWDFFLPSSGEAHLNEADNSIYHWNGTAWNKIGSTSANRLVDLADVDTSTHTPRTNDILVFNGTNWAPSASINTFTVYKQIPSSPGSQIIDFTRNDWRRVDIKMNGEARDSNKFLTVAMQRSDGRWTANGGTLTTAYIQGMYGTTPYTYADKSYAQEADWFHLTYARNDANWYIGGPYFNLELSLTRMYDYQLMMHHRIIYYTSTGRVAKVEGHWTFDGSAPNQDVQKIVLKANDSTMRLGFVGTMVAV